MVFGDDEVGHVAYLLDINKETAVYAMRLAAYYVRLKVAKEVDRGGHDPFYDGMYRVLEILDEK